MPTYTFENKETGETHTSILSLSEREKYLLENPHMMQLIVSAPAITAGVGFKPSDGFRDMLGQMKKANPRSTIDTF